MMEQDDQGWSYSDKLVCGGCVGEPALRACVEADASPGDECDFCGNEPSAPLDTLVDAFMVGVRRLYYRAIDELFWADDITPRIDSRDLVDEFADAFEGEGLLEAVRDSIHDESWVAQDFAIPHADELLGDAWQAFCAAVKFDTRYVIWLREEDEHSALGGEIPVGKILQTVARVVDRMGLIQPLAAGSTWWRAQTHVESSIEHSPSRLGTVPSEKAKYPNRMNPAGIAMFYGAADAETAVGEVAASAPPVEPYVTWAAFQTSKDCRVVDFTKLAPVPSIFDPEQGDDIHELRFLHRFVEQLSTKARAEWEAVDYVPTQVLTEFFLRVHDDGNSIAGLIYPSAVTGRPAIVLDVANASCVEEDPTWPATAGTPLALGLVGGSANSRMIANVPGRRRRAVVRELSRWCGLRQILRLLPKVRA